MNGYERTKKKFIALLRNAVKVEYLEYFFLHAALPGQLVNECNL